MRVPFRNYTILFLITTVCCHLSNGQDVYHSYPEDRRVSDSLGRPKDSLVNYFPQSSNPDSGTLQTNEDNFMQSWYSSALWAFREPILYNYYLNKDIYRFLWLRSFHRPVVLTLTRMGDVVILRIKLLDRIPDFLDRELDPRGWPNLDEEIKGKRVERFGDSLIVIKAARKADIVYDTTKICTLKDWDQFELLVRKIHFWQMPVQSGRRGFDGSEWIMEGHFRNRYRFVARWSPRDHFRDAGLYLIKLSGLKEEIY